MPLYEFEGKSPKIASSSYIHPEAVLIGNVVIGEKCLIGAGAVLRGDYGIIIIGDGSNVQENCVLHTQPDTTAVLEKNVRVAHGAIIHGPCTIQSDATVGMGSIICEGSMVGTGSLIGAGCLLGSKSVIPPNKLVMGNPAKVIKDVTEKQCTFGRLALELYQGLCERYRNSLRLIKR